MMYLKTAWMEFYMDLRRRLRYRFSFLAEAVVFVFTFLIFAFSGKTEGLTGYYGTEAALGGVLVLLGYSFWQASSTALGFSAGVVESEAAGGLLESKLASPTPVPLLFFARLLSSGLLLSLSTQIILIALTVVMGIMPVAVLPRYLAALPWFFPSLGGMFGMGLILGGLTLRFKRLGQFTFLVQAALLIASDIMGVNTTALRYLIPYLEGIDLTRRVFAGLPVTAAPVLRYLSVNLIWLALGVALFSLMLERNRKKGTFTAY